MSLPRARSGSWRGSSSRRDSPSRFRFCSHASTTHVLQFHLQQGNPSASLRPGSPRELRATQRISTSACSRAAPRRPSAGRPACCWHSARSGVAYVAVLVVAGADVTDLRARRQLIDAPPCVGEKAEADGDLAPQAGCRWRPGDPHAVRDEFTSAPWRCARQGRAGGRRVAYRSQYARPKLPTSVEATLRSAGGTQPVRALPER